MDQPTPGPTPSPPRTPIEPGPTRPALEAPVRHHKPIPEQISELWNLVVAYAKQETVDPFKTIGRYLAFGIAGALLIAFGILFLAVGCLRGMQELLDTNGSTDAKSALPYVITIAALVVVALVMFKVGTARRRSRAKETP